MKKALILFLFVLPAFLLHAQQDTTHPRDPWYHTREGNDIYKMKNYSGAEKKYRDALLHDSVKTVANYNLGNALYQQEKYDEAGKAYADAMTGTNKDSLARAWHNLGNSMLKMEKYEESISAYKQALRMKPGDEDTRYNLAYAQKKLKKRTPPQQSNSQNKQNKQKQQQQNKQQQKQKNKQEQNQQQQKPQQEMTKEEAQKILDAMKNEEKKTRDRLNKNRQPRNARSVSKEKDW